MTIERRPIAEPVGGKRVGVVQMDAVVVTVKVERLARAANDVMKLIGGVI